MYMYVCNHTKIPLLQSSNEQVAFNYHKNLNIGIKQICVAAMPPNLAMKLQTVLHCCPYLKSPHHTCGTPHNICGTPQVHVEFLRNPCVIPHCFAELRKGFTTCGICSTSHIGIFSASIWKICGKFRLSFFT